MIFIWAAACFLGPLPAAFSRPDQPPDVVEHVIESVVTIKIKRPYGRVFWQRRYFLGQFVRDFFDYKEPHRDSYHYQAEGSGVVVSADGFILTNAHVVAKARTIIVQLHNGMIFDAEVIGFQAKTDLALLRIQPGKMLRPIQLADSTNVRVGEEVLAIGNPLGYSQTVTKGIVSALGRERKKTDGTSAEPFIQFDAPIHPGNSGGPVINMRGEMIGLATAGAGQAQGIGFAIPSKEIVRQLPELEHRWAIRHTMSVMFEKYGLALEEESGESAGQGRVMVTAIIPASIASETGLQPGDQVVRIGSAPIDSMETFLDRISSVRAGTEIRLEIRRRDRNYMTHLQVVR